MLAVFQVQATPHTRRRKPNTNTSFPVAALRDHVNHLTSLAYKENTYKSYNRAWSLFTAFTRHYVICLGNLQQQHVMEYISYLSLAGFAPASIQLYVAGVRTHLHWCNLTYFQQQLCYQDDAKRSIITTLVTRH